MTAMTPRPSLAATLERELQQAVSDLLSDTLTARAQQHRPFAALPRLRWSAITNTLGQVNTVVGRTAETIDPTDVSKILAVWADALELTESDSGQHGTKHYVGHVGDQAVRLWGVVDPERFEHRNAETEELFTSIDRPD